MTNFLFSLFAEVEIQFEKYKALLSRTFPPSYCVYWKFNQRIGPGVFRCVDPFVGIDLQLSEIEETFEISLDDVTDVNREVHTGKSWMFSKKPPKDLCIHLVGKKEELGHFLEFKTSAESDKYFEAFVALLSFFRERNVKNKMLGIDLPVSPRALRSLQETVSRSTSLKS